MALLYLGVMMLLQMGGVDIINDVNFPAFVGSLFAVFAGVLKIWRVVSM